MNKIKKFRLSHKLTQIKMAAKANIPTRSYQNYEAGKRVPDAFTAIKIAKALGTTVEELWASNSAAN